MGEKFRKIGERLWYNKERIVLGVMVLVLGWNVYQAFYPPPVTAPTVHTHPVDNPRDAGYEPTQVPDPPEPRVMVQWKNVYSPNPFWYQPGAAATTNTTNETQDAGITLIDIKEVGAGKYRAQLKTASSTKWYNENEAFESFEIRKIDPDNRSVEVYSERLGKVLTLTVTE